VAQLHDELVALRAPSGIVGRSPLISQALALADKVARHPSTVLITGESGTGKELIARHIHDASPRASRPFVAVNCAAIPEALLESELFGHAKGAFTGAMTERQGLFEEAHEGTLFLDELGDLPVPLQVKLLRALQEGEVRRVGDNASRSVDVRLVAATARDLEADVADGRFRADLYYRVNVVRIHLPALRERTEDVPELVHHFVERFNRRFGLHISGPTSTAMRALVDYPWPGNVRELENIVERAMVLADGPQIGLEHLPTLAAPASRTDGTASPLDLSVKRRTDELERALIKEALERTRGNRTRAAKLLDLSHRALLYKIRDYGLGD
jgi:two-component system, NtrC family, response regulator AtoC